jgi:seryl-tRNA synthetase
MSQQEDELNDNELDSLLADLESRSSSAKSTSASSSDDDDEDLEAFLSRLDSEESSSSSAKVATKERDDELDAQFAELDNMAPDDLPAKVAPNEPDKGKAKKSKAKKSQTDKKKSKDETAEDGAPSRGARIAKIGLKWAAFALPVVVLAWVLGAFLANWISAGWLIAIVAMVVALGVPALATHLTKKGKFSWWAAGMGVLLTAALTAPMPETAGETMIRYGHWPASAVADLAGWDVDTAIVQINASAADLAGGLLYSGAELAPNELGTDHLLEPAETTKGPDTPKAPDTPETQPTNP